MHIVTDDTLPEDGRFTATLEIEGNIVATITYDTVAGTIDTDTVEPLPRDAFIRFYTKTMKAIRRHERQHTNAQMRGEGFE